MKKTKRFICLRCHNPCDGTIFNERKPICRICFDEFIAICGVRELGLLRIISCSDLIKLFIGGKIGEARIKKLQLEARRTAPVSMRQMRNRAGAYGSSDERGGSAFQTTVAPMPKPWQTGLREGTEVDYACQEIGS